jgi:E3 ubiquitin-protein ligase TRIP12
MIGTLRWVNLLLTKVPLQYKPTFQREGVFHEIEVLAVRDIASSTKSKDKDKEASEAPSPPESGNIVPVPPPPVSAPTIPGFKKLSSLSLKREDVITLHARIIRFKYLASDEQAEGDSAFEATSPHGMYISARCVQKRIVRISQGPGQLICVPSYICL